MDDDKALSTAARESLSSFLQGYSWDVFLTATFSRQVGHPRQALELVAKRLHLGPFGRSFLAAERFYLGGYHVHGLAAFREDSTGVASGPAVAWAQARLGRLGWSRVGGLRNIGGAAGYCAKYITKQTEIDYDFYGDAGWLALED